MRKSINAYTEKKLAEYGDKFDPSDLNPEFFRYYDSNERIEVEFTYGDTKEIRRGRIGVTTGWKPCFLLMARVNCISSSATIGKNARVLRVICS